MFYNRIRDFALLVIILVFTYEASVAQGQIQGLETKLESALGNEKAQVLNQLAKLYLRKDAIQSIQYAEEALKLSIENKYSNGESNAHINLGNAHDLLNDHNKALNSFKKALAIFSQTNNRNAQAYTSNQIGLEYKHLKKYSSAGTFCKKALKIYESLGDKDGVAHVQSNLGDIYHKEGRFDQAIAMYKKTLSIDRGKGNHQGVVATLSRIGSAYSNLGNYGNAEKNLEEAMSIAKKNNLSSQYNSAKNNLAIVMRNKEEYSDSKTQYEKDQEVESQQYLEEVKEKSIKIQQQASNFLDQIAGLTEAKQLIELKARIQQDDYNIRLLAKEHGAAQQENKIQLLNAENNLNQAELDKKMAEAKNIEIIIYAGAGALLLVILLVILIYSRYKAKQRANIDLAKQNDEITKQKNEIFKQKSEIEENRDQLAKQNQQISDSIDYAKRIQTAVLPSFDKVASLLPDSMILFKPKAKVSGDFYWVKDYGDSILFAAVDCTGHGVPGAFMSIIGNNILNQIVTQYESLTPSAILKLLSQEVIRRLQTKTKSQTENDGDNQNNKAEWEVKDGMDIALCSFNKTTLELTYAGAHNPLYMIRDGELSEWKGEKLFLGGTKPDDTFTDHKIQLQKGDVVYLFSDGFPDQRGGPEDKKFYYGPFQDLLMQIHQKPMEDQRITLDKTITDWIGTGEQIDDMIIFGVRV
ncbi:MAG: hypothetical protein COB85_01500 [Bacteroidetes bacterium]|nr:MAG: hypothetical protein COB85_01500 [Bacteroidota bacterium]